MQNIEDFLARNEIKKAEIAIAKYLRSELDSLERAQMLIYRARARLRSARPEEAIDDLLTAREISQQLFEKPEILELLGDAYLARFEMASVGFADRSDTGQASQYYQHIVNQFPNYSNLGWVYYQLGRIALTNNTVEMAESYFQRALLTPSHVRALTAYCYERLGFVAFYEKRDLDLALGFFNKAIDTIPLQKIRLGQYRYIFCAVGSCASAEITGWHCHLPKQRLALGRAAGRKIAPASRKHCSPQENCWLALRAVSATRSIICSILCKSAGSHWVWMSPGHGCMKCWQMLISRLHSTIWRWNPMRLRFSTTPIIPGKFRSTTASPAVVIS
jgi:tetratricopeptide (TPR) repeat protein